MPLLPARNLAAYALLVASAVSTKVAPAQESARLDSGPTDLAVVLARPLFESNRRPDTIQAAADTPTGATAVPRLTGIMLNGANRRAIFASQDHPGKLETLQEGGQIGAYRVVTISLSAVTLSGPGGVQALTPRFANGFAIPAAPLSMPSIATQLPTLKLGPERFEAPVGPMGLAMYRYSPAAPHAPPPVPQALVTP